jgi:opacity protein-like surface antigen
MAFARVGLAAAALAVAGARPASAQMVGVPVLQNAFLNPGVTFGANFAAASGAQAYGGALAWVPRNSKVQLSGGLGVLVPDDASSHATWGTRAMFPISAIRSRSIGVAAFVGGGGSSAGGATETRIPIGASLGYRATLGERRAISAYVAPFLDYSRLKRDSVNVSKSLFRVSFGVDVAIASQIGLTVGYEWGARAPEGSPGPAGGLFGVGLSYALRKP